MTEDITISRQKLYDLVWSKPVSVIAIDFGISDVGLAKICKKLKIPRPGLGYWAKRKHGHQVRRKPLSKLKPGDPDSYTIHKADPPLIEPENEVIEKHRVFESRPENQIVVKKSLRNPHPFVQQSKARLERYSSDHYHRYGGSINSLDMRVCKPSFQRALLILDALVKALERRGFRITLAKEYGEKTKIIINGENLHFRILESVRTIPNASSEYEGSLSFLNKVNDYVPTGKLSLRIEEHYPGEKSISDGKTQRLEDSLNNFVLLLVKASEIKKIKAKEAEIWDREYEEGLHREQEEQRKKELEQQMITDLFENATKWDKCVQARAYIAAAEKHAGENPEGKGVDSWVDWANKQVDQSEFALFDPNRR